MFGHPIGLNFEGADSHNTALGGCCSVLIKIAIAVYVFINVKKLVLKEDDNIITQIYYEELADAPDVYMDESQLLVFWSFAHTKDHYTPVFLDEEGLDKIVKFDYV
jgi:hypothetical protein